MSCKQMTLTTGLWKWPVVNIFTPNLNSCWSMHFKFLSLLMRITTSEENFYNLIVIAPNHLVSELVSQWVCSWFYYIIRIQFKQVRFKVDSNVTIALLSTGEWRHDWMTIRRQWVQPQITQDHSIFFPFLDFIIVCNDCIVSNKDFLTINWSSMVVIF